MPFEFAFLDGLQTLRTPLMDALSVLFNCTGAHGELWIALAFVLALRHKTREAGLTVALALILHFLACNLFLKPLIARPRPCDVNGAITLLVARPNGWSFPSGHTSSAFAFAAALCAQKISLGPWAMALAAFIGFTRLYLYVHFPTDVLAGALLGVALGVLAAKAVAAAEKRRGAI